MATFGALLVIVFTIVAALSCVNAAPCPSSLESDLTILMHNDLYGNMSSRSEAVIVLSAAQSFSSAQSACASLGEKLWMPPKSPRPGQNQGVDLLHYLGYENPRNLASMYWIARSSSSRCTAINQIGLILDVNCNTKLPALCTQSAPYSSASSSPDTSAKWQTTVRTGSQEITGFRDRVSFRFEGIRYATQPERFTYSSLYRGSGAVSALSFGRQCIQTGCTAASGACSEDCLFLNVWTPYLPAQSNSPQTKLKPVMFWIHGGAFTGGTGSDSTFDGGNMASRGDVVIVTINYRLSTLGFLALEDGKTNGNFGLADQIVALEWVQAHIRDFGGDPNRVTIFGQSAGAASVRALLASPKAKGLFAAAIPQSNLAGSNYATTYSLYYTIGEEVSVAAQPILNATGCQNVACLRAYDPYELVSLNTVARYVVVDGAYITSPELPLNGSGYAAKVPVLMGFMHDDGAPFIGYPTTTDISQALSAQYFTPGPIVSSGDFPVPSGPNATLDVFNVTSRVATDSEFRCLDQATAYTAAKHHAFPSVYFYEFDRSYQTPGWDPNAPVCDAPRTPSHPYGDPSLPYFKCHSGELYYVFGNLVRMGLQPRDQLDIPFSQFALDTWTAFARTYDPNPDLSYLAVRGYTNTTQAVLGSTRWTAVSPSNPTLRQLQAPRSVQVGFKEAAQCNVLGFPLDYYESH